MMHEKIRVRLKRAVTEKVFPGCVVGAVTATESSFIIPVGRQTYDEHSKPLVSDSVFDVASITKAIPVSLLALHLIERSNLSLTQKVSEILPQLRTNYNEVITVWHLLTQTLTFETSLSSLKSNTPDEILEQIHTTQFTVPPGKKMSYANASSILLGLILEQVTGKSLARLADEIFFTPLQLQDTTFYPEALPISRIVPTERDPWRGKVLQGEVHDESAYTLRKHSVVGSAGLFSTVPDLLIVMHMLLQMGIFRGKRYLSEKIISQMAINQMAGSGVSVGLGWELFQPHFMGNYSSEHTFGKTGFTGCVVMGDINRGKALVMLSNYHYPDRKKTTAALNSVRRDIADIVFAPES